MIENYIFHIFFFIIGSVWGSFANVIIVRLPQDKSIITPRSRCNKCGTTIRWYHNMPIFSWIFLRGKCAYCGVKISMRYPVVEFIMGAVFAYIYHVHGLSYSTLDYLIFAFGVITASFIDIDHMILPDRFTLSGIVLGLIGAALNPEREFMDAFIGFLIGGGFLYAMAYTYYILRKVEGMGGGDIKLLGWIGAVCGMHSIPFVIIASSFLGIFFGIFYMIRSKDGLKTGIPFGPYLSMGALIYIMFDVDRFMSFFFAL